MNREGNRESKHRASGEKHAGVRVQENQRTSSKKITDQDADLFADKAKAWRAARKKYSREELEALPEQRVYLLGEELLRAS